jgi:lincosamide nucleotidyltransferase A/C/D/E
MSAMTETDVLWFLDLMDAEGIAVCVDGGWCVDALLETETRAHEDLDIAVRHEDVPRLRKVLENHGFSEVPRDDTWECNFVLEDAAGRSVDVHSYVLGPDGTVTYGVPYPPDSLVGEGRIGGRRVCCVTPEYVVEFHTGYPIRDHDRADVAAICSRFSIPVPEEYREETRG